MHVRLIFVAAVVVACGARTGLLDVGGSSVATGADAAGGVGGQPMDSGAHTGEACADGLVTLASGQGSPYGIALDAKSVYWTNPGVCPDDNGPCTGTIMKVPLGGGKPITLASHEYSPGSIAVDATSVYWLDRSGPGGTADGAVRRLTPK